MENKIYSINGPVVTIKGKTDLAMMEMVYVGKKRLIGEVIRVQSDFTTIQVYEGTTGLMPGEPVTSTGAPMSATLGPGIINNIAQMYPASCCIDIPNKSSAIFSTPAYTRQAADTDDTIHKNKVK